MPLLLMFAAGVVLGKSWHTVSKVVVPFAGNAAERFDTIYSRAAQTIAQRVEDVEDRVAEKKHRAANNGSAHIGSV